jgi:hypothetical protein
MDFQFLGPLVKFAVFCMWFTVFAIGAAVVFGFIKAMSFLFG